MESHFRDEVSSALEVASADLDQIESILMEASEGGHGLLKESSNYLANAGGKRIRPSLAVLASMLAGGPNRKVHLLSAAVEMTHIATLYHDDVIDDADLRRGVPSVNEKWGNTVAILAGDYLFARASALAAEVGGDVPRLLAEIVARVIRGQVRELEALFDARRTAGQYMTTIEEKTASLLEAPARIGALVGGSDDALGEAMSLFGTSFGFAYQIADDLLDLAASQEELGKQPGTDLRDGVYTLPVIYAIESNPAIASFLGDSDPDIDRIRIAVAETGAFDRALLLAREHADRALKSLEAAPVGPARDSLEKIVRVIVDRVPALEAR